MMETPSNMMETPSNMMVKIAVSPYKYRGYYSFLTSRKSRPEDRDLAPSVRGSLAVAGAGLVLRQSFAGSRPDLSTNDRNRQRELRTRVCRAGLVHRKGLSRPEAQDPLRVQASAHRPGAGQQAVDSRRRALRCQPPVDRLTVLSISPSFRDDWRAPGLLCSGKTGGLLLSRVALASASAGRSGRSAALLAVYIPVYICCNPKGQNGARAEPDCPHFPGYPP